MKTFKREELAEILRKHKLYLEGKEDGERANLRCANLSSADLSFADLSSANLRSANLSSANLRSANLSSANLRSANLRCANLSSANLGSANLGSANLSFADLRSANLSSANLSSANLRSANLRYIKEDFYLRLAGVKAESVGLYKAIVDGKIDGSCYEGECCCFVGTVAKNLNIYYESIPGLAPDSESPTEKFFTGIRKGDTPENNPVSAVVKTWLAEFMDAESLTIPVRTSSWS